MAYSYHSVRTQDDADDYKHITDEEMYKYALDYVGTKNYNIADHWSDSGWASSELITFVPGKFDPVGRVGWSATTDLVNTGALNEEEDQDKKKNSQEKCSYKQSKEL